jgi:hypothetical protein
MSQGPSEERTEKKRESRGRQTETGRTTKTLLTPYLASNLAQSGSPLVLTLQGSSVV